MNSDLSQAKAQTVAGSLVVPSQARFAIVAGRANAFIVDRLVEGAFDALLRHGAGESQITLVRVPGSWEIPLACARLAQSKKFDAVIAVSAVIRGGTPHFEYIAAEVSKGMATISLQTGVPVTMGVLTTDSLEQAVDRAGAKSGNKGFDAALAAIEMVSLLRELTNLGC
jgi:6,7-dimethyl-8-ribityllumazine synthase